MQVAIGRVGASHASITQNVFQANRNSKFDLLLEQLDRVAGQSLVFVEKKASTHCKLNWCEQDCRRSLPSGCTTNSSGIKWKRKPSTATESSASGRLHSRVSKTKQ